MENAPPDPAPDAAGGSGSIRGLLRELRESAREAGRLEPAARAKALEARTALRERIVGAEWDHEFADALREHLGHVDARLEHLEGLSSGFVRASTEILELRGDLTWLPAALPDRPFEESVTALETEFSALSPAVNDLAQLDAGRAQAALDTAQRGILEVLARRLEERVETLTARESPEIGDLWKTYLQARDLANAGHSTRPVRLALRDRIAEVVAATEVAPAAEALARCAAEYEDRALDVLAAQSEQSTEQAARALEAGRREIRWLLGLFRETLKRIPRNGDGHEEARKSLRRWNRRLKRAAGRMTREAQEVGLQARLEGIFGRGFVAVFENLILWLILVVVGILTVEFFLPDPHPDLGDPVEAHETAKRWAPVFAVLMWTDAAICFVFLLEFFTKLSLVRGRFSWFLRHFLVDFVPSIPYGLMARHGLDALRAVRLARFMRATRMIRYIRLARPLARAIRFGGFLQRGLDRMVRQHGALLNRNIVLFEPAPIRADDSEETAIRHRMRDLRVLARKAWRRTARELSPAIRSRRVASFLERLPPAERILTLPASAEAPARRRAQILRAEELVARLTGLDAGTVEAEIGLNAAERISGTLRRLDVPVLRFFPGLKQMVRAARDGEALERVASAGKALGRWLGRRLAIAHWVSDLSGVITGPQFLDRFGAALVKATARPAKRLLMFGLGFLVLNGIVEMLWDVPDFRKDVDGDHYILHEEGGRWHEDHSGERIPYDPPILVAFSEALKRILGTPFLILGAGCLGLLLLGAWFRRVAGEATDFYTRTAEAQYINLLKSAKLANLDEDLEVLWQRILRPERLLRDEDPANGHADLRERFESGRSGSADPTWADKVLRLYRDYLDGAIFHSSDTKTTSQLLGNLSLENIRTERLETDRRERKRLGELDLDRERSVIRGPYFWFHSVNHSVAQWSAKLILEYNRHAIPLAERSGYPDHVVEAFEDWLDRKIRGDVAEPDDEEEITAFVTTEFTALHFLTRDPARDARIRERFGEKTLQALIADSQAMIRTIMGTYPFHRLPRTDRTVNPFDLYARYVANGRAILLPIYFLWLLIRVVWWLVRRVRTTLKEILRPTAAESDRRETWASYGVAVRKISRMRKPLFMECARFRCVFDPEYLGLPLLIDVDSGVEGRIWRDDLERIGARDSEWDELTGIREERVAALQDLAEEVKAAGGPEKFVEELRDGTGSASWKEAFRAVAVAYGIDYRSVRSLSSLEKRAREISREAIRLRGRVPGSGLLKRAFRLILPSRSLRKAFAEYRVRFGPGEISRRERRWLWRAIRADFMGLRRLVELGAALEPGMSPRQASREVLANVAQHPESWSEQLVTLRTVQALSVLDIRNYRRQVWELGGYAEA